MKSNHTEAKVSSLSPLLVAPSQDWLACFGTNAFLIIGILEEAPWYAFTMSSFRAMHVVGGIVLIDTIFGSKRMKRFMEHFISEAGILGSNLEEGFCRKNVAVVGLTILLCLLDICMVEFLPWKESEFYNDSRGFPTIGLMKFCLVLDAIICVGTVVTQMFYLISTENVDSPATNSLAKTLFCLNIIFNFSGAIAGLVFLYLKVRVLRVKRTSLIRYPLKRLLLKLVGLIQVLAQTSRETLMERMRTWKTEIVIAAIAATAAKAAKAAITAKVSQVKTMRKSTLVLVRYIP